MASNGRLQLNGYHDCRRFKRLEMRSRRTSFQMATRARTVTSRYQVVPLSSDDPVGSNSRVEPHLSYLDALMAANEYKAQGKAFRVNSEAGQTDPRLQSFFDPGAVQ